MDKQKQIEEMTKDMLEYGMEKYPTGESVFAETKLREQFYHVFLTYAEYLINKGYCKVQEDALVIPKEEYENLLEKIRILEVQLDLERTRTLEEWLKIKGKHTANKIMNDVSGDVLVVDTKEYGRIEVVPLERLDEICKEFTEGV